MVSNLLLENLYFQVYGMSCVSSSGNEAFVLRGTFRCCSPRDSRPISSELFRSSKSFSWTLIFSRQRVARARIRLRQALGLPRDFLLRQSVHVPFFNDLARVLLNFCFVFHLFSTFSRNARRDVHACMCVYGIVIYFYRQCFALQTYDL